MEAYEQTGGPRVRPPNADHLDPPAIERLAAPVPRYTSYPTAPHFHAGVTSDTYRRWLSALPDEASLSLYLHIPSATRSAGSAAARPRSSAAMSRSLPI